jgi:hypothetical protein
MNSGSALFFVRVVVGAVFWFMKMKAGFSPDVWRPAMRSHGILPFARTRSIDRRTSIRSFWNG